MQSAWRMRYRWGLPQQSVTPWAWAWGCCSVWLRSWCSHLRLATGRLWGWGWARQSEWLWRMYLRLSPRTAWVKVSPWGWQRAWQWMLRWRWHPA